ncbi:methyltransferase-like protein 24 [Lates japonicus]|uniref:Methyltransferase-like protein 24 n=1 Tax=Lates japonicus TaxID=270547 RepID=A0AAD3NK96_LATJO|nr:methyltransferase-like protein 24 [Lates japonicus]
MRTCARCWGRWGSLPLRSGILLLLIPPFILALQLLVVGPWLPRAARAVGLGLGVEEEEEGAVAFSVISIEPERSSRRWGTPSRRRPGLEEEEEEVEVEDGEKREETRAYEDENEIHWRQVGSTTLEVQPWAADKPSFTAELHHIITYITRPAESTQGFTSRSGSGLHTTGCCVLEDCSSLAQTDHCRVAVFQNWIESGTCMSIIWLLQRLQWAGFEVEELMRKCPATGLLKAPQGLQAWVQAVYSSAGRVTVS